MSDIRWFTCNRCDACNWGDPSFYDFGNKEKPVCGVCAALPTKEEYVVFDEVFSLSTGSASPIIKTCGCASTLDGRLTFGCAEHSSIKSSLG